MSERSARSRVRKEMLRGAFDDNIEALTGQPAGSRRQKRDRRKDKIRRTLLTLSVICLTGISVAAWFALPEKRA